MEKIAALFTSKDMAISEPLSAAREWASSVAGSFEELLDRHAVAWSHLWRRSEIDLYRRPRLGQDHQPAHLPPPPDRLGELGRSGCGCSGPGLARRGLPGACVLGRAVRVPLPQLALPGADPFAAALPLPPAGPGPAGGHGGRLRGGHVPLAERQRRAGGDPDHASQPTVGPVAARPDPAAISHQRGGGGQHLAVLPGHRRRPVPAFLRGRDDPGDRPLLGQRVRSTTTPSTATRSKE